MANPRLDFFRFTLKHKSGHIKTFRQFMLDAGKCTSRQKDSTIFANLYKYFMDRPTKDFAKNDSLKKVITLISNPKGKIINKHYDKRPNIKYPGCIISGVMNGGPYGKERIVTRLGKKDNTNNLATDQPVLQYYYIFVYLPLDHNEGFFMIHSDSLEESITKSARNYIAELFKLGDYQKPVMTSFVPKNFWEEYKKGATLMSMSFKSTILDNQIEENDPIKTYMHEFDVKITLSPKNKANLTYLEEIKKYFAEKIFGNSSHNVKLDKFNKISVNTKNIDTNSSKTFDWNNRDQELMPTVYLKDRIRLNDNGTPDFSSLDLFCHQLFNNEILPDLRPDLYVKRMD